MRIRDMYLQLFLCSTCISYWGAPDSPGSESTLCQLSMELNFGSVLRSVKSLPGWEFGLVYSRICERILKSELWWHRPFFFFKKKTPTKNLRNPFNPQKPRKQNAHWAQYKLRISQSQNLPSHARFLRLDLRKHGVAFLSNIQDFCREIQSYEHISPILTLPITS